jgi:hypothetical protein
MGFDLHEAGGGGGGPGGGSVNFSAGTTSNNLTNVVFNDSPSVSFGLAGSTITASVNPGGQTNQTLGIYFLNNTTGESSSSTHDARTLSVRGDGIVSAGWSNSSLRISATQSNQNAVASNGNFNFQTLSFSNANGLSFGTSAGSAIFGSYTVPTVTNSSLTLSDTATSMTIARLAFTSSNGMILTLSTAAGGSATLVGSYTVPTVTNSSWTVSDTATSLTISRLAFTQSNGLTLTLSTAAGAATVIGSYTVPTVTNSSWTVSDNATSGTVARLAFTNLNGVTLSLSSGAGGSHTIVGSHNALTSQSNQNVTAGNGGFAFQTLSFSNANNFSFGTSAGSAITGSFSQLSQSAIKAFGASNTGNTAGNTGVSTGIDWVLAGSNNITISESTVGGGPNTLWVSGPTVGGAQTGISGIVVSNTTYTSGTVSFSNQSNITIGSSVNGATQYIRLSVADQTTQSAIKGFGASNTGNTAGNTGISTGIDWVIAGTNNITVSESTVAGGPNTLWLSAPNVAAGNVTFSAGTSSGGLGSIVFGNSNSIDFGLSGSTITASFSGNLSAASGSLYATGNTTHNSSSTTNYSSVLLNALGGLTAGFSNGSIELSVPAQTVLTGSHGISLSSNGSTITISAIPLSQYDPDFNPAASSINSTLGQSSLYFMPFDVQWPVSASRINFFMSVGSSTNTQNSTGSASHRMGYGLYSRGTGASSDRIMSVTSYSLVWLSMSFSSNSQFNVTLVSGLSNETSHSTTTTGITNVNATNFLRDSIAGFRAIALPVNVTMTPGRYWLGYSVQSTTANQTNMSAQASILYSSWGAQSVYRPFGIGSTNSSASLWGVSAGLGTYSAQSAAWPVSIALTNSDIRMPPNNSMAYFNFSGIGTSTNIL